MSLVVGSCVEYTLTQATYRLRFRASNHQEHVRIQRNGHKADDDGNKGTNADEKRCAEGLVRRVWASCVDLTPCATSVVAWCAKESSGGPARALGRPFGVATERAARLICALLATFITINMPSRTSAIRRAQ